MDVIEAWDVEHRRRPGPSRSSTRASTPTIPTWPARSRRATTSSTATTTPQDAERPRDARGRARSPPRGERRGRRRRRARRKIVAAARPRRRRLTGHRHRRGFRLRGRPRRAGSSTLARRRSDLLETLRAGAIAGASETRCSWSPPATGNERRRQRRRGARRLSRAHTTVAERALRRRDDDARRASRTSSRTIGRRRSMSSRRAYGIVSTVPARLTTTARDGTSMARAARGRHAALLLPGRPELSRSRISRRRSWTAPMTLGGASSASRSATAARTSKWLLVRDATATRIDDGATTARSSSDRDH